MHNKN